jgi:hypothetical protein
MIATRIRFAGAVVVVVALITMIQPPSPANAACTTTQLRPTLAESMVTQGVGGTGAAAYARLTRGEDTLVKLFLMTACTTPSAGQYVRITNASLQVSSGNAAPNTLITSFASTPALSATTQANSPADPIFVVPATNLVQAPVDSDFTATFTATVTYSFSDGTVAGTGITNMTFPTFTKPFDAANALRVYVVPMGDASQAYNSQYTPLDQTIVQNAMQTLSRIYPTSGGVGELLDTAATQGVRYIVDTATMLDLRSVTGAYVSSGGLSRFCGTSANFSSIKGLLAQYLLTYNKANKSRTADRVVGVIGGNVLPSIRISWGTEDGATVGGCADGMASVSSAEAWVRLVPDQSGAPSRSGALAAMEVTHTFGLEATASYHSSNVESDAGTDRAYNLSGRSRIANDHSVMNYNTSTPWNNDTTLLEANDFASLFCKLRPSSTTGCSSPGKIGTSTGVAAGDRYIIAGTTDGTPQNTIVIEPYFTSLVAATEESTESKLRLLQFDSSSSPSVIANFGVPWGAGVSDHDAAHVGDPSVLGGVQTFYAAAEGFSTASGEVRLVKLENWEDPPTGSTAITLFSSVKPAAPPTIDSLAVSNPPPTTGGSVKLGRSQITPRIPPKPDIVFLADTTGSMTRAIDNVKSKAVEIMQQVLDAQPNAQFGVAAYQDQENCPQDAYMFNLDQALTATTADVQAAINRWTIGDGCDLPEAQLNALYRLGIGNDGGIDPKSVGYREGSSRVVVWFGDAPGHDPSGGHSESAAIAALTDNNIRVVAVSITSPSNTTLNTCGSPPAPTCSSDLDGQADRIAAATDGVVKNTTDSDQVSQAILDGLHDLPITVTPVVNSEACDSALSVAFSPTSRKVTSGTTAEFAETVTVGPTSAGRHTCEVRFKLDGQFQSDPAYTQVISIDVGGTQQKYVEVSATAPEPEKLLLDLIYECAASGSTTPYSFVAAVAVPPTAVTSTTATFNANADTTNACARFGGGGTLVPYVSDGWNRVAGAGATTAETNTLSKKPTAAIYTPTVGTTIKWGGTLSLRGSGHVAGVELPASALSWTLTGPPSNPKAPGSGNLGTGATIDKPAPAPDRWASGVWTITLTATWESRTATATRTFEVTSYQFIGFLPPVANPPQINTGTAGKTFALKWQLNSDGIFVSDVATAKFTQYALLKRTVCDAKQATTLAMTSGQSILKYSEKDQQFVFNWQTPSQVGLYLFRLTLDDGTTHDACVNLK